MCVSTVHNLELDYSSTILATAQKLDVDSLGRLQQFEINRSGLGRVVVDALGASVWGPFEQTFCYRWIGEDTFSSGDPDAWIMIKWVQHLFESDTGNVYWNNYGVLQDIFKTTRVNKLEALYSFRNASAVRQFLEAHPNLIELLLEAYRYLQKHFGSIPQIVLELVTYPDETAYDELVAWIQSEDRVPEGLEKLEKFEDEWFLDHLTEIGNSFNFNIEFK